MLGGKFITLNAYIRKEWSKINNLSFNLRKLEKEKQFWHNKRRNGIKIRGEINKIENKKSVICSLKRSMNLININLVLVIFIDLISRSVYFSPKFTIHSCLLFIFFFTGLYLFVVTLNFLFDYSNICAIRESGLSTPFTLDSGLFSLVLLNLFCPFGWMLDINVIECYNVNIAETEVNCIYP